VNQEKFPALPCTYAYKPPTFKTILALLFFAAAGRFLVHRALTNQQGLDIYFSKLLRIASLSVFGATIFYWCFAGISIIFCVAAIGGIIDGLINKREVVLTEEGIVCPRSSHIFNKENVFIPYDVITSLRILKAGGWHFLEIVYFPGRKITLLESKLSKRVLFEIHDLLEQHITLEENAPD